MHAPPSRAQVEGIYTRVLEIAKGAALMSGTTYDIDFVTGYYDVLPNSVISHLMVEKLRELAPLAFSRPELPLPANCKFCPLAKRGETPNC